MRLVIELGLNHRIVITQSFFDRKTLSQAVNVVWAIFVLEKQLSYSLGVSAAVYNPRIDPDFPRPVRPPLSERIQLPSLNTLSSLKPLTLKQ